MVQLHSHWMSARQMVRSRAWRQGYASFRRGEAPDFQGRGPKALAYEYGRLTAALMVGEGAILRRVSPSRPLDERYLPELAAALERAAEWPEG